jgi:hypothetical protein
MSTTEIQARADMKWRLGKLDFTRPYLFKPQRHKPQRHKQSPTRCLQSGPAGVKLTRERATQSSSTARHSVQRISMVNVQRERESARQLQTDRIVEADPAMKMICEFSKVAQSLG